jgi:hypothetical protein
MLAAACAKSPALSLGLGKDGGLERVVEIAVRLASAGRSQPGPLLPPGALHPGVSVALRGLLPGGGACTAWQHPEHAGPEMRKNELEVAFGAKWDAWGCTAGCTLPNAWDSVCVGHRRLALAWYCRSEFEKG